MLSKTSQAAQRNKKSHASAKKSSSSKGSGKGNKKKSSHKKKVAAPRMTPPPPDMDPYDAPPVADNMTEPRTPERSVAPSTYFEPAPSCADHVDFEKTSLDDMIEAIGVENAMATRTEKFYGVQDCELYAKLVKQKISDGTEVFKIHPWSASAVLALKAFAGRFDPKTAGKFICVAACFVHPGMKDNAARDLCRRSADTWRSFLSAIADANQRHVSVDLDAWMQLESLIHDNLLLRAEAFKRYQTANSALARYVAKIYEDGVDPLTMFVNGAAISALRTSVTIPEAQRPQALNGMLLTLFQPWFDNAIGTVAPIDVDYYLQRSASIAPLAQAPAVPTRPAITALMPLRLQAGSPTQPVPGGAPNFSGRAHKPVSRSIVGPKGLPSPVQCDLCAQMGHYRWECPQLFNCRFHAPYPGFDAAGQALPDAWVDGAPLPSVTAAQLAYHQAHRVTPHPNPGFVSVYNALG